MNILNMMNLLIIFVFTLLLIMQPGMGTLLPPLALGLINATALKGTDAPANGKGANGTTTANTTATITTLKPLTTTMTSKEQVTTKGSAATPTGKATTALRKDAGYMGYINDLFDLENSMRRKYQKRRSHGAPPTKAAVGGTIVAHPLMYYNMAPPRMQAARIDLELSYKPSESLGQAVEDGGNGATSKHKPKMAPTLPPLLEILSKPQQHPEMPAIMEFLNGIVDLVINSSSSNSKGGNESKPYGYINKTISPDGKHQRKEFGLRAPNMVIKGVQQETMDSYGVPLEHNTYETMSEVLGPAFKPMKLPKKVEPNYGVPSEKNTYDALDFLGPAFKSINMPKKMEKQQLKPKLKQRQQHRREPHLGPQYELLHGGIDTALRKNYEMIDRLLEDLEQEDELLQKKSHPPKEELIVSCPIHHEFHADRYGDIVEEDLVDVGECEAVKVLD